MRRLWGWRVPATRAVAISLTRNGRVLQTVRIPVRESSKSRDVYIGGTGGAFPGRAKVDISGGR